MYRLNLTGEKVKVIDVKNWQVPTIHLWYNKIEEYGYATGIDKPVELNTVWEKYKDFLSNPDIFFACIYRKDDDEVIGVIRGIIKRGVENSIWILSIFILNKYQNLGYGSETISLILGKIRKDKVARNAYISVARANCQGVNFWEKMGFEIKEQITPNPLGERICKEIVIMEIQI